MTFKFLRGSTDRARQQTATRRQPVYSAELSHRKHHECSWNRYCESVFVPLSSAIEPCPKRSDQKTNMVTTDYSIAMVHDDSAHSIPIHGLA